MSMRWGCRDPGDWGSHLWATEFSAELEVIVAPLPTPSESQFSPLRQGVVVEYMGLEVESQA